MPVTLSHPMAVTWEDRIWVFSPGVPNPTTGGTDPNPWAYEFDPASGSWTPHAFTPPVEWGPLNGVPVVDGGGQDGRVGLDEFPDFVRCAIR